MAHVIHSINIAVSGSCHHADAIADAEHHQYALALLASAGAVLLGRNTFDLFASFWPGAQSRSDLPSYMTSFATALEAKPKYVASSRNLETKWQNTQLLRGPDLHEIRDFLAGTPEIVVVFGSPGLGASLAEAGLVQELHTLVQPFIGPASVRPFENLTHRKGLALLEARPFQSAAVLLRYATKT